MGNESNHHNEDIRPKRSVFAFVTAAAAGVIGVAFARRRRSRRGLPVDRDTGLSDLAAPVAADTIDRVPTSQRDSAPPAMSRAHDQLSGEESTRYRQWMLVRSLAGLGCFVAAQSLLLGSRSPVLPLILYAVGFMALMGAMNRPERTTSDRPLRLVDGVAVVGLMAAAALIFLTTPTPDAGQTGGLFWTIALVLAVYLLGWMVDGPPTALFAAGFAAVSLWTLALGKAEDNYYIAIAAVGALFLAGLFVSGMARRPIGFASAVALGAFGLFFAPVLVVLLLPVLPGLILLDSDRHWKRIAGRALLAMVAGGVIFLVMFPNVLEPIPDNYRERFGFSPTVAASDALFSSLLLFNLTSDPNPLHGIVDRPVFDPILAGLFLAGLLGLAWRVTHERGWRDGLLLAALVIAMLPVTREILPPLRYPNLQRAALALPVAMVIAAWAASRIAALFQDLWGKRGLALAMGLFLLALPVIAADTRRHYADVFFPTYGRVVPVSDELEAGG